MPPRLRMLFLKVGTVAALAGTFAGGWIAATGTYRPPMWLNAVAATGVMGAASVLEGIARSRRPRPVPARHRRTAR